MSVQTFLCGSNSFPLTIRPEIGLLDHMVVLSLISEEPHTVFHNGCTNLNLINNVRRKFQDALNLVTVHRRKEKFTLTLRASAFPSRSACHRLVCSTWTWLHGSQASNSINIVYHLGDIHLALLAFIFLLLTPHMYVTVADLELAE